VYKVKTTAPKRYIVRPPQGVVLPGQEGSITLAMVKEDAAMLWREQLETGGDVRSDDKFLVQTAEVSREYYDAELAGRDEKAASATLADLWKQLEADDKKGGGAKKIKSSRLTARFAFNANAAAEQLQRDQRGAYGGGGERGSFGGGGGATDDLVALRHKFTVLFDYMHVVEGERDLLRQENAKIAKAVGEAEAAVAKAKAQAAATAPAAKDGKGHAAAAAGGATAVDDLAPGFGLVQVLVVALAAFLAGRIFAP